MYSIYRLRHLRLMIGQSIRTDRTKRKMTLARLSKLSGILKRRLDRYERGEGEISLEDRLKVECALNEL